MAETKIEWAHFTFNGWIGCSKTGPGCDNCYAEVQDAHRQWTPDGWGPGKPRYRTSEGNWKLPPRWDRKAQRDGVRYRVFSASLADWLDNEVPIEWLVDLLDLIRKTPNLDWLLLTKRIGRFEKAISIAIRHVNVYQVSEDLFYWLRAWESGRPPHNVWLGATIVNQPEADRDITKLLALPARIRWLSMEPLLGSILVSKYLKPSCALHGELAHDGICDVCAGRGVWDLGDNILHLTKVLPAINWGVVGGESGGNARPSHPDWSRSLRDQFFAAGKPFLFKQWGEWTDYSQVGANGWERVSDIPLKGRLTGGPLDGQVFETLYPFPQVGASCSYGSIGPCMVRVGKDKAGRLLDGELHNEFPA